MPYFFVFLFGNCTTPTRLPGNTFRWARCTIWAWPNIRNRHPNDTSWAWPNLTRPDVPSPRRFWPALAPALLLLAAAPGHARAWRMAALSPALSRPALSGAAGSAVPCRARHSCHPCPCACSAPSSLCAVPTNLQSDGRKNSSEPWRHGRNGKSATPTPFICSRAKETEQRRTGTATPARAVLVLLFFLCFFCDNPCKNILIILFGKAKTHSYSFAKVLALDRYTVAEPEPQPCRFPSRVRLRRRRRRRRRWIGADDDEREALGGLRWT